MFSAASESNQPLRDALDRIRGEFLEMPGLRLTDRQAQRLLGLDAELCATLIAELLQERFLVRTRDGSFMRVERATPAKAGLVQDRGANSAA
jgi:hypothetical protein